MTLMLGKLPPKFQDTDLLMRDILQPVAPPSAWDWDTAHPGFSDDRMFDNDRLGCCVIAGRAHQTLCFEYAEQGVIIPISDKEVEDEYFSETGGQDSGLVIADSLKQWRKHGWTAGGKNYRIDGYARLDVGRLDQVHAGMVSDLGIQIGFNVPASAIDQFNAGVPWTVVGNDGGIQGGHDVFVVGYEPGWLTCMTWGKRQTMSEEFFSHYTDEAWAVIDSKNKLTRPSSLIDCNAIVEWWNKHRPEPNPFQ